LRRRTVTERITSSLENGMQIQINSDRNVNADQAVSTEVSGIVDRTLSRFSDDITRLEVHLSDENSAKKAGDDDMRCMIEARMTGQRPIAVTHQAATVGQAVSGAADKLSRMLESILGKRRDQRCRSTEPPAAPDDAP
jgi:ribosome-associated translation inhibitor RaiA